jgi:hypothetical protein
MPSFPGHHHGVIHLEDLFGKSWGVYAKFDHGTSQSFTFDCVRDKTLSLSISKPVGRDGGASGGIHDMTGVCKPGFDGWGGGRRLVQFPTLQSEKHFEPFGVGGYVSLAACETTCPSTNKYTLVVNGTAGMPYTVGAGMTESFGADDLAFMSFYIRKTFAWTEQYTFWFLIPALGTPLVSGLLTAWRNLSSLSSVWRVCALVAAVALRTSSNIFTMQLIYLGTHTVPMGGKVVIPLIVHIVVPLVQSTIIECRVRQVLRERLTRALFIVFALYNLVASWQGYLVPTFCLLLAGFLPERARYYRVSSNV